MGFKKDHVRFLEDSGQSKPYMEQNFLPPAYIGQDGEANLDNISLDELSNRSSRLAADEKLKPSKPSEFDPDKASDPLDFQSKPTNPKLQTVELPLISDVWNGMEPINYHAQIQVGMPPQTFFIDLDSGSSLFWLQAIIDPEHDGPVLGQHAYRPAKSVTAIDTVRQDGAKYGDGDVVQVNLYTDQVFLGKMTILNALIGAAPTSLLKDQFQLSKANGILGLGFPTNAQNASRRNLVQLLYDRGMVKHASFALIGPRVDPKLATKIDKKMIMQPRGTFVIGSVDPAYYTGSIAWCPQIVSTNRWIVQLDKITINGKTAFKDQRALIDTGTAYIVASPKSFAQTQTFIPGAKPIEQKKGLMFSFPSGSIQTVGFVLGGREFSLQPQDFGLGGVQQQGGQMCSSIVKLSEWPFEDNLWIIGGIFLDNVVTIFDYEQRKVGFADISEKDLPNATPTTTNGDATAKETPAAAAGATASPKVTVPDIGVLELPTDPNDTPGRETATLIQFGNPPETSIVVGINSISLGYQHIRATVWPSDKTPSSFTLNFNASTDYTVHGSARQNPSSDTVLRSGRAAWLRVRPDDPMVKVGRLSWGKHYPVGAQLPDTNTATVQFGAPFAQRPKVVLWIAGMDFSKTVNWRLQTKITSISETEFSINIGPWAGSILYMADVCWIAHGADMPSAIQSGTFSTEEIRNGNWALQTSGYKRFERPFEGGKVPRVVCALKKIDFGYYRDLRVETRLQTITAEGFAWSMNSSGDVHQYATACSYIAFDPDLTTLQAALQ